MLTEEKQTPELALSQDKEDWFLEFFPSLFEPPVA